MDIQTNSNISNQVIQSISGLKLTNKYAIGEKNSNNELETQKIEDFKDEDMKLSDNTNKNTAKAVVDVDDIRKYANIVGEDLTIDDINYGLMFGRSVIADYSA